MITYINGKLIYKSEESIIVEANNIGYSIVTSESTLYKLPECGKELKIYTYLQSKEDGMLLYGFITMEELNIFKKLITVSGIGPKGALGILGTLSPQDLYTAIISEDVNTISKAPGIGKKTASRLIIDLKDKIKTEDAIFAGQSKLGENMSIGESPIDTNEAVEALAALGYTKSQAYTAVSKVDKNISNIEEVIKQALKILASI